MLTPELANELTRLRIAETNEQAINHSRLGQFPADASVFAFRRPRVIPLVAAVEVRHAPRQGDRHHIERRLGELRR